MRLIRARIVGDLGRGRWGQADAVAATSSRVRNAPCLDLGDDICLGLQYARMRRLRSYWCGLRYETGRNIAICVGVHIWLRVIAWRRRR